MQNIPDKLISAYLDGTLDEDQAAELSEWVQASKDHARYIASLAILEHGLIKHPKMKSNSDILAELETPDEDTQPLPPIHIDANALTKHKYLSALSYVLRHTFTPKRLITVCAAAALLLGTVLAIVLMTGPDPQPQIVEHPSEPGRVGPATPIVATLTTTHDAVWDQQPGEDLHPGDRLTLTAGFAEITTNRGAIAILEAPATVELLDNNALRLHAGKLVGICETPSSKGFLVRTPHMDITDLGTRFGIDASQRDVTEVHVYEGEVKVARPNSYAPGQLVTQHLTQGQAIKAEADTPTFVAIEPEYDRFAIGLGVHRLVGTGEEVEPPNRVDPNWQLVAVNGERLENKIPLSLGTPLGARAKTPNDPNGSRWLEVKDTDQRSGKQETVYTIETSFDLPQGIDLDTAVLLIDFHVDDQLEGIDFNDRPYADWGQVVQADQDVRGKGTALIPLRDVRTKAGANIVHLRVSNAPTTQLYIHIAWQIEDGIGANTTN